MYHLHLVLGQRRLDMTIFNLSPNPFYKTIMPSLSFFSSLIFLWEEAKSGFEQSEGRETQRWGSCELLALYKLNWWVLTNHSKMLLLLSARRLFFKISEGWTLILGSLICLLYILCNAHNVNKHTFCTKF